MTELRKSPRLPASAYLGPLTAHLTFVTRRREELFKRSTLAGICRDAIFDASKAFGASIHAYCIMPDHVHVLLSIPEGASLQDFAHRFKQISGFLIKRITGAPVWQTSYYDHVLRDDEGVAATAHYIWQNPVAEGLALAWTDYEFSGPTDAISRAIDVL